MARVIIEEQLKPHDLGPDDAELKVAYAWPDHYFDFTKAFVAVPNMLGAAQVLRRADGRFVYTRRPN